MELVADSPTNLGQQGRIALHSLYTASHPNNLLQSIHMGLGGFYISYYIRHHGERHDSGNGYIFELLFRVP